MSDLITDPLTVAKRNAIVLYYTGPKSGLPEAAKPFYAWVGTYFQARLTEIVTCFDERPNRQSATDPGWPVVAEVRLDLDGHFAPTTKVPDGLQIVAIPRETTIAHRYKGPLTGLMDDILPWMDTACKEHDVAPGYRRRMLTKCASPEDPDWELEVQLMLRKKRRKR
jgi:hypothetical protein